MVVRGLRTNRVSIEYTNIIQWNEMCRFMLCYASADIWTRSARMGATSVNNIKSFKPYSKLTSIEHSWMNYIDRQFEDLEYLNNIIIQYWEILSNVTERVYSKLFPPEVMDVRFGRSTFIHFELFHCTSHSQRAGIIIPYSIEYSSTEFNGLQWWKIY